jgi:hypothetical protein
MLAIKLANACWRFCETFSERNVSILLVWMKLFSPIVMVATVQPDLASLFFLVSLGVADYSWEIGGMDFVTELNKSSEFQLTTILDLCLPSDMTHFLSCHKKSPLTKQLHSLLINLLNFMVYHTSLCLIDTLPCWQIRQSLMRKLNTKLIMSAARHPHIDGLIKRVDETVQVSLRCYSSRLVF